MISKASHYAWRACLLGGVNGLIFGGIAEFLREMYGDYQERLVIQEFESQGMSPPLMIDFLHWWAIPVWATLFFILVSILVHRYWANRLKSPLLLWQLIGVISVTVLSIFWLTVALYDGPPSEKSEITRDVNRVLTGYTFHDWAFSDSIIRDWLVALVLVMLINLIYGAVIQISATLYGSNRIRPGPT